MFYLFHKNSGIVYGQMDLDNLIVVIDCLSSSQV
uniref:Uncharacterized protein n=1 Tax=uncultured Thiotrichaceae bacterium TaxID=298394 RepID=A0A6S6SIZ9_9GAMM|nr:MAG: Unknown protein [uncultured Thiotrichaceae bacterium]